MPEIAYIDEEGITYYVDGSYRIVEGGDRYDAQGHVIIEDTPVEAAGEAAGEAAPELGSEADPEPGAGEVLMGEGEPEQLGSEESEANEVHVEQDQENQQDSADSYEGVTAGDFEDFEIAVYSRLDALNTVCMALVVAVFMAVGVAAVDTLIRTLERV